MFHLVIFFILTTFLLSEYLHKIYKESKYYKDDVVCISYVGNHSDCSDYKEEPKSSLKTKDL